MRRVQEFYEKYPFPQLPLNSRKDLLKNPHDAVMRRTLATANLVPEDLKGKRVLEAGCGTAEKTLYFAAFGAKATGIDLSSSSISIARESSKRLGIKANLRQLDLFSLPPKPLFDHVFSMGVIHHTKNPREAFHVLARCVKPTGTLTVGVYNSWGRFPLRLQRLFLRLFSTGNTELGLHLIERFVLKRDFQSEAEKAYIADKFLHPRESFHSLEQLTCWFRQEGFEITGINPSLQGSFLKTQFTWLKKQNGFFTVSGLKRG